MKFNTLVLILSLALLTSCKDDPCEGSVAGPDISIPDDTKSYISNYTNSTKIVFLELNSNQEVEFTIDPIDQRFLSYSGNGPCPTDTTVNASINGNSESIKLALSNTELDQSIVYALSQFPAVFSLPDSSGWEILIQYGNVDDSPTSAEQIMILELDEMAYNIITDSLTIGGNTFYDVIEIDASNPGFDLPSNPSLEVKLTREDGVVYINDIVNSRELVYLRVE